MSDNQLPLVNVESLTKSIINRMRVMDSQSQSKSQIQILKPTDMSTHPDNKSFVEGLEKLCTRMEGNPAQQHYDKFMAYSCRDISDRGAIFNEDTYEDNCGPRIGVPQYGKCNNRVYTEVLRGTDIQWVELQKKWKTPMQYIKIMEKSIRETGTLSQWWEFYPNIYGNKYKSNNKNKQSHSNNKQSNSNDKQSNNNNILSSTNNMNKPKPSRKRKYNNINANTEYHIAPPPPQKKMKQGGQIRINVHKPPPLTTFAMNNYYDKQQTPMNNNNIYSVNYFHQENMNNNQQNMINNQEHMNYNQQNMKHKSQYANEFGEYGKYNYYASNDTTNKILCNKYTNNDNDKSRTKLNAASLNSINDSLQIKGSKKIKRKKRKKRVKKVKKSKNKKWKKPESNPDGMDTFRLNCEKLSRKEIELQEMGARGGRCLSLVVLADVDPDIKLKRTPTNMKQLISKALRLKKGAQILLGPTQNYNQINKSYKPSKDLIDIVQKRLNKKMYKKIKRKYTKWINKLVEDQSDDDSDQSDDDSDQSDDDINSSSCSDSNSSDTNDNNEPIQSNQFIEKNVENDIINDAMNDKDKKNDNKHIENNNINDEMNDKDKKNDNKHVENNNINDEMNYIENKQPKKEDEICEDVQNMQIQLKNLSPSALEQMKHFMNNLTC